MLTLFDGATAKIIGSFLLGGVIGFSMGNGHTTTGALDHVAEQYGHEKVIANCEHKRAEASKHVAIQAELAANADGAEAPDVGKIIGKDCPH